MPAERSETPPGRRIADVALLDQRGNHHRLFRYKADKGLVLYSQRVGCPIVNVNLPKLAALRARYEARGIRFLLYNSAGEPPRRAARVGRRVPRRPADPA